MRRTTLFLFLLLASCLSAMAQQQFTAQQTTTTLREGEDEKEPGVIFEKGFCYFDIANMASGETAINSVGVRQADVHISAAIKLPPMSGVTITGIQFLQTGKSEGTIFIAERKSHVADSVAWTLRSKQNVTGLKTGRELNTFTFSTPVTIEAGKDYVVGYETVAGEDEQMSPISFAFEPEDVNPNASFLGFVDSGESTISEHSVKLMDVHKAKFGNLLIVALCKDGDKVFANPYYLTKTDLGEMKLATQSIDSKLNTIYLPIAGMASDKPNKATFEVVKNGEAPQSKEVDVVSNQAELPLGDLSSMGKTQYTITLKQVNGKATSFTDPALSVARYSVTLMDPANYLLRRSILVERFTGEKCANCPPAEERLANAIKKVDIPVIIISHHIGYYPDFLTIEDDKMLLKECILPQKKKSFAPAFVLNRLVDPILNNLSLSAAKSVGMYMEVGSDKDLEKQLEYMKALPTDGIIEKISRKKEGETYAYTITGKVTNSEEIKNDTYITMCRIQGNISPKEQLGANNDFMHNDVIRNYINGYKGQKVECQADGSFTLTINNVTLPTGDDVEDMHFIFFIHRNAVNKDYSKRYVMSAVKMPIATEQGVTELPSEDAPQAYTQNGHIYIKGMADSFVVYSIGGEQVATSSNEQLPQGIYIVRIQLADSFYTSKVVVR